MKKFDVEFARIEEYTAEIIWDGDLFEDPIEAETAEEAVELAKQWMRDHDEHELEKYSFRAAEVRYDEDGYRMKNNWKRY